MTTINDEIKLPCGAVIKNRLCKAAMTEGLADSANRATDKHATLYGRWADGGAGLLLTGNIQVDHRYLERPANVVIEGTQDTEQMARLEKFAEAGTRNGTHLWAQISHAGRQTPASVAPEPVAPSDIGLDMPGAAFGKPRALGTDEILDIIERFGHAASVAKQAGFTGVEIHGAHGYLISEFLSPDVNIRDDAWGGSLANRARFLLEIVRRVRREVGADFPIGLKLNSADFQRGGFSHDEAIQVAEWLNEEGLDLLEISGGTYEQPKLVGLENLTAKPEEAVALQASTIAREAYFLNYAKDIRAVAKMPMMVVGGFRSRKGMNAALGADACDMIGIGRPLCVQPDVLNDLLSGAIDELSAWEKSLEIGLAKISPRLFGLQSSLRLFIALNGWGQQGWWCLQLLAMGAGQEPDLSRGVFRAFLAYQASEKRAAKEYNKHWN